MPINGYHPKEQMERRNRTTEADESIRNNTRITTGYALMLFGFLATACPNVSRLAAMDFSTFPNNFDVGAATLLLVGYVLSRGAWKQH